MAIGGFSLGHVVGSRSATDTEVAGAWDQSSRSWVPLERAEFRNAIMKGLRVARKEASIDVLSMPIQAPEAR